jgi:hypothetical protein
VFQNHAFDDVGDRFAAVGGVFQNFVKLFPFNQRERVGRLAKKLADGAKIDFVRFVFEAVNFDDVPVDSFRFVEQGNRRVDLL